MNITPLQSSGLRKNLPRIRFCFSVVFLAILFARPQPAAAYTTGTNAQGQTTYTFAYTGASETFIAPVAHAYRIELWGASGTGNALGGYTRGEMAFANSETIYVYVGQAGAWTLGELSFNGGGGGDSTPVGGSQSCANGGGATDVRTTSGTWNNTASLRSRIMVAGGGGGVDSVPTRGHSGGLTGYNGEVNGNSCVPLGATQTAGGTSYAFNPQCASDPSGIFGVGASSSLDSLIDCGGGGGGGYYGGGAGSVWGSGSGGSSFISGHTGSVAIISASNQGAKNTCGVTCTTGINNNCCSIHYSNKSFTSTTMIDGAGYNWTNVKGSLAAMPNHNG
ncbi:glycine rich domain-containing protein, partial [Microgenomates group bacterium]|nr:glycine rich domain-containing protein [Microgenomates group bacterium]